MRATKGIVAAGLTVAAATAGWLAYTTHRAEAEAPAAQAAAPVEGPDRVTALGRLEPKDGVIRIAGPSRPSTVIQKLLVDEGDRVRTGQVLAILDSLAEDEARVARIQAELSNARAEWDRWYQLFRQGTASASLRDAAQLKVDVAKADLAAAVAARDLASVRSPIDGQVVKVYTRSGERVGPSGILELAQNDRMYAVAEVYETDIGRVKVGQKATIASPAFETPLTGTVETIGLKIGKMDVLSTDPTAKTDARVVEVKILLDDAKRAAGLTNLQVEVAIQPG
jgi:HlyD family secretion protein